MSTQIQTLTKSSLAAQTHFPPGHGRLLQRKCACGGTPGPSRECDECKHKRLGLQTKLTINQPGDRYEQEADRVADAIVNAKITGRPPISSSGSGSAVQRQEPANEVFGAPPIVDEVLQSPGQPLDVATRELMETQFGYDFSRVRVHANAQAAESAQAVNAHAYTIANHLVFDTGRFSPRTIQGQKLLAHELTHVVQQERLPAAIYRKIKCDPQASLSGFFSGKGVKNVAVSDNVYDHTKGGALNFEQEILIDMLASPRLFHVDGDSDSTAGSNLDAHVKARTGIVTFASKKQYSFASVSGWKMNPEYYDWDVSKRTWKRKPSMDRQKAWEDLNINPQLYAIGCAAATELTMKGGSKGANIINKPSSDTNDWVPADAGYIENTKFPPGGDIGVLGENLIYTGNGLFWGHLPGSQTYRTLADWIKEVASWHKGSGRVDDKRELPATGLLDT
jgi:hypothetical protein